MDDLLVAGERTVERSQVEESWIGPECLVLFDEYGGPANIDMLLSARDNRGRFVVAIEAKADESFGPLVSPALPYSLKRPSSKGLAWVQELAAYVLGPRDKGGPPFHHMRYQLLTAAAAALSRCVPI